ncbi:MAG: carboxypeptidase-like regulatory domain-containing protein [Pirellulaceae bacterium]
MRFLAIRGGKCLIVAAIVVCLAFSGCSKKEVLATGSVKGKVTLDGKPLPAGCKITFMHQEKSFPATGDLGSDGSYSLAFNGKPAVPVGTYDITVVPPKEEAGPAPDPSNPDAYKAMMMGGAPSKSPRNKTVVPAKYLNAAESGLTCTVVEGQETVFDVDLKSGG